MVKLANTKLDNFVHLTKSMITSLDRQSQSTPHVTVVGAGIVGACCAASLLREGYRVSVIDRAEPGMATSFGNAGSISPSAVLPVAMPGMWRRIPGWLSDPLGPLTIRWSYLPFAAPWLLRFLSHARRDEVERVAAAMRALMATVFDDYARLLPDREFRSLIRRNGCLYVYQSKDELEAAGWTIELRRQLGAVLEEIGESEIRQLEPSLSPDFRHGLFAPDNGSTIDPRQLVKAIMHEFLGNGGEFTRAEVQDIEVGPDGPIALITSQGRRAIDKLVIAAGAWSALLASKLGMRIPLETQRGYHVTFSNPGVNVNRTVMWNARSVFVNPMEPGLRIAGTVELAGLNAGPNYRRADRLSDIAADMFPDLDRSRPSRWMGHRPCLPDSLPVIDRSPHHPNVVLAFGHQHVGMCLAAPTGRLVADIMVDRPSSIDRSPYSVSRFMSR